MARYNKNRTPERWPKDFSDAVMSVPLKSLIGFGDAGACKSRQQKWCLFLRSLNERPNHPLNKFRLGYRPRTKVEGKCLYVKWEEWKDSDALDIEQLLREALGGKRDGAENA